MPNYLYEIREDSDCLQIMREEDIDPSEGRTRVRCHIRHEP